MKDLLLIGLCTIVLSVVMWMFLFYMGGVL
jgi:hypothetical protein